MSLSKLVYVPIIALGISLNVYSQKNQKEKEFINMLKKIKKFEGYDTLIYQNGETKILLEKPLLENEIRFHYIQDQGRVMHKKSFEEIYGVKIRKAKRLVKKFNKGKIR